MKTLTIRIDKDFEQKLRKKSDQKNIKFSRYLRSLLDKGLAVDTQLEASGSSKLSSITQNDLNIRTAEMISEILIHTRKLIETNPTLSGKTTSLLLEAEKRSKNYVNKLTAEKLEL